MLDPKALLPEVQKLLPQYSAQELIAGIKEFEQAHPDLNNQQALQALTMALSQQKQGPQAAPQAPQPPFQGLVNSLPQGVR
jgi:hypothetical protein